MAYFTNFAENKISDFHRGQTLTLPSSWYIALGSSAAEGSFTEITGVGLSRVAVTRALASWAGTQGPGTTLASNGTSHVTSNNGVLSFGTPTGFATATHAGFYDAPTGGNVWMYIPVDNLDIDIDSDALPVEIAAAALSLELYPTEANVYGSCGGSDYLSNKEIDLIWRGQAFSWPANTYLARFTVAPTSAGGGTECAGGGYARVAMPSDMTQWSGTQSAGSTSASSGSGGRISNNVAVTFPSPSADQGTTLAVAAFDAATLGNLLWFGATAPKSVPSGAPAPNFAVNTIGLTVA